MPSFADRLEADIRREYTASQRHCGWRLLYSPVNVVDSSDIAFIGLNPGGASATGHSELAMKAGSAYDRETWGEAPPGHSRLQRQVLALFGGLGVEPAKVLAGNLVPFRSPSWADLADRKRAVEFGASIWTEILGRAKPTLVITMGALVLRTVGKILGMTTVERHQLGWGRVTGSYALTSASRLVGLPHLSRYGVITRTASQSGLQALLGDRWNR